jgi:hypothetical protein
MSCQTLRVFGPLIQIGIFHLVFYFNSAPWRFYHFGCNLKVSLLARDTQCLFNIKTTATALYESIAVLVKGAQHETAEAEVD